MSENTSSSPSENIHVQSFGIQNLREIVIGFRSPDNLRKEIRDLQLAHPSIRVRHARPSSIQNSMILEEISQPF